MFMRRCFLALPVIFCLPFANALAAVFTIDPTQTEITLGGTIVGVPVLEQGAGSLKTKFQGTINADITGTTIRFPGGSTIDAITNGVWQPGASGVGASLPADFAGRVTANLGLLSGTLDGAFRNIVVDVTSASLPLSASGSFDASQLIFGFLTNSTSVVDYRAVPSLPFVPAQMGQRSLTGAAANKVTSTGTLSTVAGVQTLVFQVDATFPFTALTQDDSNARITGQLVATAGPSVTPVLNIASVALVAGKVEVTVDDASASLQLQATASVGTVSLINWVNRTATKQVVSGKTVFTVDPIAAGTEFFRALK